MDFCATPTLTGTLVTLEQLSLDHTTELEAAVRDGELWRTWYTSVPKPDGVAAEIDRRLAEQSAGMMAPWAIRRTDTGSVCGMTTYMNIASEHARLEIGSTWMAPSAHGAGINADAKLQLLTRAFDDLKCNVVEFRTHWHNQQSRAAIARLGAKQDGVLRNHQIWKDGSLRDTVVFSVIGSEWPAVRGGLTARVARHAASG